ncbi:ABC transporter ATP-binding protein/permease [Rhizobiaceae bacterium n13]|uniref:ABC transporter ATP-binding protein/permease n=1 Tax=Ferirhizobium litorale TaxID=2927786 RepID=A0AAE3U5G9_9HYPH|nr:ABC transporter ATP-binding protein [Fererhizobium litorale]MDI7862971.1 ABC transporter ATP-binding protein/permease [Fererhizobium litorale]MDI7924044.1 ABC transporter ATP-binding protein/permease [Fererhizobium litorale]
MILVGLATSSVAWLSRSMVNNIFVHGDRMAVWAVGGAIMLAFVVKGVAGYCQTVLMGTIGCALIARLQQVQFHKLIRLRLMDYTAHPGGTVSRAIHSARSARNAIVLVTTNLARDLVTVIALLAVMVAQDPFMSMFAFVFAPVIVWGVSRVIRETKRLTQSEADMIAGLNVLGVEALQGVRVVKAFNLEPVMDQRINDAIESMERRQGKLIRVSSLTSPMFDILAGLIIGSFIFYAGWQTINYGKTPGEFMAFITAFLLAYDPAKRLGNLNVQLQRELVGVKRAFELIDHGKLEVSEGTDKLEAGRGALSFENVTFAYKHDVPTIKNLSFSAAPGEKVAIVGRSGAGKSTIINLILGMYRPSGGSILIDDTDISTVTLQSLRDAVSYVAQDTFLFSGSIRENVAFGQPNATEEGIVKALEAAQALDFVRNLPDGLDTDVGNNGANLSGGQRQRISIARAFLKDAPILLLDEATSALDGDTEKQLQAALDKLSANKTTITVAHRLSTILNAQKVIVVDAGEIVAEGTHETLQRESNVYKSLFVAHEIV